MARQEQDREDLMREATALHPRAELQLVHETVPIFWGQKKTGAVSFYFGSDPVYQFDREGHLRRAYLDGRLYRTQGTTLARLTRVRTAESSHLERYDLTEAELHSVQETLVTRFQQLAEALADPRLFHLTAFLSDGTEANLLDLIRSSIALVLQESTQLAPRMRGKR